MHPLSNIAHYTCYMHPRLYIQTQYFPEHLSPCHITLTILPASLPDLFPYHSTHIWHAAAET